MVNNIYGFFNGFGVVEVIIVLLVLVNFVNCWLGLLGGLMVFIMLLVIFLFLIIILEVWVFVLGDVYYGFSYLFGVGCLVLKDILMLVGVVMIMVDLVWEIFK